MHIAGDKVLGIDHDFSFPSKEMSGLLDSKHKETIRNKGLPKFVDATTKDKILQMTADDLLQKIRPYLSTEECTCTQNRLADLQRAIQSGQISGVSDWQKEVIDGGKIGELHEGNSYLYGVQEPKAEGGKADVSAAAKAAAAGKPDV